MVLVAFGESGEGGEVMRYRRGRRSSFRRRRGGSFRRRRRGARLVRVGFRM